MQYCEKCRAQILGEKQMCPLCQGELTGAPEGEDSFPRAPLRLAPHRLLLRLLALGSVAAVVVCAAVDFSFPRGVRWSVFVAAGLASAWVAVGVAVRKRRRPLKAVLWQMCALSLLALAWDHWTGGWGWSVDFVLPILYMCTMVTMTVIARLMRLLPQDCLLYLVLSVLFGVIPLVLLVCGVPRVIYPSVVCAASSLIFLAALLLFEGGAMRDELARRLHI